VELRHLRYFLAVAEELNFRRTADRLHLAQPSLSAQIRQLEAELGCALLHAPPPGASRSLPQEVPSGRRRAALAAVDEAVHDARRVDRGETGRIRVGSGDRRAMLSPVVGAFRTRHPEVALDLEGEMLTRRRSRRCWSASSTWPSCAHRCTPTALTVEVLATRVLFGEHARQWMESWHNEANHPPPGRFDHAHPRAPALGLVPAGEDRAHVDADVDRRPEPTLSPRDRRRVATG
jgi:DNA-binding transcriptional LysR family regulator